MKLAIMQPYLFPYIGYFQLIHSVDKFVFYDDVNFIKQGWINRNNILLQNNKHQFTLPIESITSFNRINETHISASLYNKWYNKFEKTLITAYKKAPYFEPAFSIIKKVFSNDSSSLISDYCKNSVIGIMNYLDIKTEIVHTSAIYNNTDLQSVNRVIDICKKENAEVYINVSGGRSLYSKEHFKNNNINLFFLESGPVSYQQFQNEFIPHLSIIDCMMFNSPGSITGYLNNYTLS